MKQTAAVIGASGGIGLEIARALLSKEFFVGAFYRSRREELENALGDSALLQQVDLRENESVAAAFGALTAERGQVDVVVYAASPAIRNKSVLDLSWADFQEHIDVQAKGLVSCVQALKPQIKAKHPTKFIVILSDYCVGVPPAGLSHYVSAKYALMGLAKALSADLARFGSTVNCVSPGMVQTGLLSSLPAKLIEMTAESNPLKRIGDPRDIAGLVAFLSSDEASYINGANITVNGGRAML